MIYRIVERGTRRLPYQVRHPLLATLRFVEAQPRPILVYQMGKVGSKSVWTALRSAGLKALHVHYLGDTSHEVRLKYRRSKARTPIHVSEERLLRPYLRLTSHRLKIVTLVRDPIARAISGEFQTHRLYDHDLADVEARVEHIRARLLAGRGIDYCANWFERELRLVFGVDVLGAPFDRERGFSIVSGGRVDVLTLKLEQLNRNWGVLGEFVGRAVRPAWENQRTQMDGADTYDEVRRRLKLPRAALEDYYDDPWMRHFYTEDEIATFCDRWCDGAAAVDSAPRRIS